MSAVQRPVRLAPASLALVLAWQDAGGAAEQAGGSEVFRLLQAANLRCFWNRRLCGAVSRLRFQGWLEGWVLLLQGSGGDLEVLREAWMRRALRPPLGYTIKAVGDVSPVQMSPVSQSQFIPLAEVVCCAISDMNAVLAVVTQDTLMEALVKHYPGIATPSQDILYSTLGNLIKERKIYHTGEGYFIVTPQTYFITNSALKDNSKWTAPEETSPLPPSVTYLVSMESCNDITRGQLSAVSHCRSCRCFSDQLTQNTQEHQPINEHDVKVLKDTKEVPPVIHSRAISTSVEHGSCDPPKSSASLKEKEKGGKKFGLGLFRRNTSKKEKPKKEYTTFAAQFPPEEWPVRDEDNLDNIPRDIEHEIIKRINPVLTVDNLMKHTVLMQKVEQQKKYISKGTSTEVLTAKQKHYSKGSLRKKLHKTTQHRRKVPSGREKHLAKSKTLISVDESVHASNHQIACTARHSSSVTANPNAALSKQLKKRDSLEVEYHCVYKKQIENPFQGAKHRDNTAAKNHRPQNCETKKSRSGKDDRSMHRSKSLDCTRGKTTANEGKYTNIERLAVESKHYDVSQFNTFSRESAEGDITEYSSNYPEYSTLRIDDKYKHLDEYGPDYNLNGLKPINNTGNRQQRKEAIDGNEQTTKEHHMTSKGTYNYDKHGVSRELGQQTPRSQSFGVCDDKYRLTERATFSIPHSESKHEFACTTAATRPEPNNSNNEGYADSGRNLNPKEFEDDDCGSLYLETNGSDSHSEMCDMLQENVSQTFTNSCDSNKNQLVRTNLMQSSSKTPATPSQCNGSSHECDHSYDKGDRNPHGTLNSSEYHSFQEEMYPQNETSPPFYENTENGRVLEATDTVDDSIFDYSNTSEVGSQAETLHRSSFDSEEKSGGWSSDQQTDDMMKRFEQNFKLFQTAQATVPPLKAQQESTHLEDLSMTGDSGIDSPRTRISLASNNSIIFDGLKRRILLPNMEGLNASAKGRGLHTQNTLLQLTPVINV